MFRFPQMKNSVNLLRIHRLLLLTLRDVIHEPTVSSLRRSCMRVNGIQWCGQQRDACFTSNRNFSTDSRRLSVVSKYAPLQKQIWTCVPTHFLLSNINLSSVNEANIPKTFLLLYKSLLAPSLSALYRSKCLLPVRVFTNQTCCYIPKHKTQRKGNFGWLSKKRLLLSIGHFAVQPRGLQTDAQQQAVLDVCLSPGNEARCRQSLLPNIALYERVEKSWAAVLVSLCVVSGQPAFLFTLRSAMLKGRHKGDVSFAGGKKDSSDHTVVDTALREAREELGMHITEDKVWGVLKPLRDASGMMIAPVIANLGALEALSFKPNPSEVEEVFTVTLEHLCRPQNRGYTHFRAGERYGYTLPVFHSPKYRVWGLTAVALDHTLKLIVPPTH
ncbi:mitochondrial coenzyme A diphosphatase NUDT8 isoform X2 [Misgurnus anguillicaudatus]|uniref:mitochondrial coenzyme A diphosphatase NUDT8 isoform X2 n=1 Tax=Misgurnus anguillicaudatus TaxID=75329 RepID=UPI003CCF5E23